MTANRLPHLEPVSGVCVRVGSDLLVKLRADNRDRFSRSKHVTAEYRRAYLFAQQCRCFFLASAQHITCVVAGNGCTRSGTGKKFAPQPPHYYSPAGSPAILDCGGRHAAGCPAINARCHTAAIIIYYLMLAYFCHDAIMPRRRTGHNSTMRTQPGTRSNP